MPSTSSALFERLLDDAAQAMRLAINLKVTVAGVESCTGGMISAALTRSPGVSAVFRGAIVAYSNESKSGLVGIPMNLLTQVGSVSQLAAREMALAGERLFRSDLAYGVTGIAGPGGATVDKPVGLTFFALVYRGRVVAETTETWHGDHRDTNRLRSSVRMVELVNEYLLSLRP